GADSSPPGHSVSVIEALTRLEGRRGAAVAALLSGEAREATRRLEALGTGPEMLVDRMAAAVLAGQPSEAIALSEQLPANETASGPALWNRGLALAALGLSTTAADAFEQVAALGEKGWADEARERAKVLRRSVNARRHGWRTARGAGETMAVGGPPV